MQTDELLATRGERYGKEGDILTGRLLSAIPTSPIMATPYFFHWVLILSKLVRALTSPQDVDHWEDIIGYATLVLRHLKGER